jgi:hypothetical protein
MSGVMYATNGSIGAPKNFVETILINSVATCSTQEARSDFSRGCSALDGLIACRMNCKIMKISEFVYNPAVTILRRSSSWHTKSDLEQMVGGA